MSATSDGCCPLPQHTPGRQRLQFRTFPRADRPLFFGADRRVRKGIRLAVMTFFPLFYPYLRAPVHANYRRLRESADARNSLIE